MATSRHTNFILLLLALLCVGVFAKGRGAAAWADKAPPRPAAPADKPTTTVAPQRDPEGFEPESRPPNMNAVDQSIPAAPLVATAYGFIWAAVLGFVLYTLHRTRRVEQELAELESQIKQADAKFRA